MSNQIKNSKIVVTGGAGFIGSHLVDSLVRNNQVKVIDNLSYGKKSNLNQDAEFANIDIRNQEALESGLENPDYIFHLAAAAQTRKTSAGWDNPSEDCRTNAEGTINLFEAVKKSDIEAKIVYASSAAVYGTPINPPMTESHPKNPISPYGIHKLTGEKHASAYVNQQGLDISTARIFNTYGERQPRYVMYDFFKKLSKDNKTLEVLGSGKQIRDYCYIEDAIDAFQIIASKGEEGEAYNLSGENVISINELAELMIDIADLNADYHNTEESWKGDPQRLEADISNLRELGFEPEVGLEKGIERFKQWFEETEGEIKN